MANRHAYITARHARGVCVAVYVGRGVLQKWVGCLSACVVGLHHLVRTWGGCRRMKRTEDMSRKIRGTETFAQLCI